MQIRNAFAALLLGCVAMPAAAQQISAQELISRNLAARGGPEALGSLNALRLQGRLIFPGGFEVAYRETRARLGNGGVASRTDLSLQGLDLIQAYDGRGGWRVNPFQGRKDAERMSADDVRSIADSSLIDGILLTSAKDGSRVEYLGREDFDGTLAYKLKVSQKDGDEFVYLLDPDTFLEIKIEETRRVRGAQQTQEIELGEYEKVGGVYFPMSVESWSKGQSGQRQRLMIASGEANPKVDAAIFAEPGTPAPMIRAGGEPPDASNKTLNKPAAEGVAADPSSPAKGE